MTRCDFIILGGGAAAFAAATVASELGAKTLMVNAGLPLGGTCVNVGCVPSKHLLEVGFDHFYAGKSRFEALTPVPGVLDFHRAIRSKDELVAGLRQRNYHNVIEALGNVTFIEGYGQFRSPNEVSVNGASYRAEKVLIATGSSTYIPPIEGLDRVDHLTNREALALEELPERLLIIGAGPLGLEFAQMYAHFGSKVTVLANHERVLPKEEPEIGEALGHYLQAEGVEIVTKAHTAKVSQKGKQKTVTASVNGHTRTWTVDQLLIATGIRPHSAALNLEAAGVQVDGRGFVRTDQHMKTTADSIWAAGDVVGKLALETVVAKEGHVAAQNALNGRSKTLNYEQIPHAVFTSPGVASVGLTEEQEMERFNACACRTVRLDQVPKALAVNDARGLVKLVVHPKTAVILGAHLVAPQAVEMIHEAVVAIKAGFTVDDLIDTVHVFPTYSEGLKLAAQAFRRDISKMSCCVE